MAYQSDIIWQRYRQMISFLFCTMTYCKRDIINAFNENAATYETHAFIQKIIIQRLIERLVSINQCFDHILDVGCGTGYLMPMLRKVFPKSFLTGVDIAFNPLIQAKSKKTKWLEKKPCYINADIEKLPFKKNQFDLIISNLALHWCDPLQIFKNFKDILKPGGLILFTVPGPDTLFELLNTVQNLHAIESRPLFHDMHDYGDHLQKYQFQNVVMDMEKIVFQYTSIPKMLSDLKHAGLKATQTGSLDMSTLRYVKNLNRLYPKENNFFPLTIEVIFGYALCPDKKDDSQGKTIPLKLITPID